MCSSACLYGGLESRAVGLLRGAEVLEVLRPLLRLCDVTLARPLPGVVVRLQQRAPRGPLALVACNRAGVSAGRGRGAGLASAVSAVIG